MQKHRRVGRKMELIQVIEMWLPSCSEHPSKMNVAVCHLSMGLILRQAMPRDRTMPSRVPVQKRNGIVSRNWAPGAPGAGFEMAVLWLALSGTLSLLTRLTSPGLSRAKCLFHCQEWGGCYMRGSLRGAPGLSLCRIFWGKADSSRHTTVF